MSTRQPSGFFVTSAFALLVLASWADRAPAATLDQVLSAARREGTIEFYATNTLTPKGAQELNDAFNKKYGLKTKLEFSPAGDMAGDVAKVVGGSATGLTPEWDLMVVTGVHHATLWGRKLHEKFDYRALGVAPQLIHYDNGTVSLANQTVLPAYNKSRSLFAGAGREF